MTAPAAAERVPHPMARPPLVTVEDLVKHFPLKGGRSAASTASTPSTMSRSPSRRRPGECSGGQLQRVVVARALLLRPRLLICDEPTSALDASVRAQILNLLIGLKDELDLTLLMISHDLRVVRHICDRGAVMYLGEIVEVASREDLFERPAHPCTQALLTASLPEGPGAEAGFDAPRGEPPSPVDPPSGCRFHPRCPKARDRCRAEAPVLDAIPAGRVVACHYPSA